jgi:hypothetical protein
VVPLSRLRVDLLAPRAEEAVRRYRFLSVAAMHVRAGDVAWNPHTQSYAKVTSNNVRATSATFRFGSGAEDFVEYESDDPVSIRRIDR